jgi:hypothetical protein
MTVDRKLAAVSVGDYVTIVNPYGRQVRGRVATVHADGHCTVIVGEGKLALPADDSNTVRVEHRPRTTDAA